LFELVRLVPRVLKRAVRRLQETRDKARLFGALAPLVPPVDEMFDGTASLEEFKANGEEFLRIYRDVCGLQPIERMLDVGSGIGRKTIPLTQYLHEQASYEGIDVAAAGVEWCRRNITSRYPNFHFQQIDVRNPQYNPAGTFSPSDYRFPYPDASFTFVALGSVFTHMLPADVRHYMHEIHRVMAPESRCLISYFLLNEESHRMIASGNSTLDFVNIDDNYATISPDLPEKAIALDERFVIALYGEAGLKIERIDYGSWCGRNEFLSYQDLILAVR
jgi:SAM-dependent methyltransferase